MTKPAFTLRRGWRHGDIGWVIGAHGAYYETVWKLGARFEAKVAEAMGEWMQRFEPAHDLLLMAEDEHGLLGSISLDGSGPHATVDGARIRFFIMAERARGRGVGRAMVAEVMNYIGAAGFDRAFLTTFRGLDAARKLYEDAGFVLTREELDTSWGTPLHEQRFEWRGVANQPSQLHLSVALASDLPESGFPAEGAAFVAVTPETGPADAPAVQPASSLR